MLNCIVAFDKNKTIGNNNELPWGKEFPEDLERFKELTMYNTVVFGKNTLLSMGKLLVERENIILTRENIIPNNVNKILEVSKDNEVFICGGEYIYLLFEPYYERIYTTEIKKEYEGNKKFVVNLERFKNKVIEKENEKYDFCIYTL